MLSWPTLITHTDLRLTGSSKFQLRAVITQNNRILAFFSCKLNTAQQKYSMSKQELLAIVETLNDFKDMLWGKTITVFMNHKILKQDALVGSLFIVNSTNLVVDNKSR